MGEVVEQASVLVGNRKSKRILGNCSVTNSRDIQNANGGESLCRRHRMSKVVIILLFITIAVLLTNYLIIGMIWEVEEVQF